MLRPAKEERPLPINDLDSILDGTSGLWDELRGGRIFMTGGTGFFGSWLLESILHADLAFGLGVRVVILTRDELKFRARHPRLTAAPQVSLLSGDVRTFDFPQGRFTHVIHAATEANDRLNREQPTYMKEVIVSGTRRTLEFAIKSGANKFLFISSGAVYGRQRPDVTHVTEDDAGLFMPLTSPSAYAEGKREAESLCRAAMGRQFAPIIARGFAFVGPNLPLDAHFAVGNFIRDALQGGPIRVHGDGTPYRSYLYAADLACWLWTILFKGESGRAYNVGSERRVTVGQLARMVSDIVSPGTEVRIELKAGLGQSAEQYVPSTLRARTELRLRESVGLDDALRRTAAWAVT